MPGGLTFDVQKITDKVGDLVKRVETLTTSDVLVGIPAEKASRGGAGKATNALLGYVHEYGSPAHNIPPRPFLIPGVRKIRQQALAMLSKAARDVLTGAASDTTAVLNQVGMLARNSVVNEITDPAPPFVPLKAATIRARLRKTAAGRRQIKKLKGQGKSLTQWAAEVDPDSGSANIHPLIDTGQLRAAITYVIQRGGIS